MIKIGELSVLTGVSIQTIRFYEQEGLLSPVEVDRWTNYRYYDESSVVRLSEISYLKDLGFSLKQIKNLDEETIKQKISQVKLDIKKLTKDIEKLSSIRKKKEGFIMKNFVNDERVIGKWKKLAVVKEKEDFKLKKFANEEIFDFKEIYFLPKGEEYWVLSWTKGTLFVCDRQFPYEIVDGKMFVGVVDYQSNEVENYAVYEKVDSKEYTRKEIRIKDNVNIPFITDSQVIGFWETVDLVEKPEKFNPNKKSWKFDLCLKKYAFEPNGTVIMTYQEEGQKEYISKLRWTKGLVLHDGDSTASAYTIKTINDVDYMIVEWKSGDYTFGGKVNCYYVLKKMN